jgi:hypothetical protein
LGSCASGRQGPFLVMEAGGESPGIA